MMKFSRALAYVMLSVLALGLVSARPAATSVSSILPPGLVFTPVITGLTAPVLVTNAADGSNRIFIVEQTGHIRIFKNGGLLGADFLNISGLGNFTGSDGEMGLLGLAFDPNFSSNGFFYITYDINTGDATFPYGVRLARYQVSSGDPDAADPSSAFVILTTRKKYTNHNGGMLAFGPDDYLYWSTGDGGSGGDPDNNSQNIRSLLGKILRLDVDTAPPLGKTYVIPPTNPFFGSSDATVRKEIWAYGLRNPWRFSFDRSTGDLFIGDVGQNTEEEVDFQPASSTTVRNYGWRILEGRRCYNPSTNCTAPSNYVGPVAVYDHGAGDSYGCSVTGGYVYRGVDSPTLQGVYFYGDFCSGKVLGLARNADNTWSSRLIMSTPYNISSFGEDEQGEVYLVDYGGQILKIVQVTPVTAPPFLSQGSLDGFIAESRENSSVGGGRNSTGEAFALGDTAHRQQLRALLSFNLSGLPANAVVMGAQISIKLAGMTAIDPFSILGSLRVDLGVPRFGASNGLESADFQATATRNNVAAFNPVPSAGWYSASVPAANARLIHPAGRVQFRLRFALGDNNNSVADYAAFSSGNAALPEDRPTLTIQYFVP